MKRKFISIYFPYSRPGKEKKHETVTVAFGKNDRGLYQSLKDISTTEIKKMISIFSYEQLTKTAERERRNPSELIKLRLREKVLYPGGARTATVKYSPEKVEGWIKELEKEGSPKDLLEFLRTLKAPSHHLNNS
ncbi:MAG: hypothetical protein PF545_05825 [Elusimicrobia bacterium]|jgi:hypothetical protein|nr:hypothetical protein [Elusimicrobiota bacterium]